VNNLVWGRDIVSLEARETPRTAFETFASRPRPAADAAPAAPAETKDAPSKKAADEAKADAPTESEKSPALAGSYSTAPTPETDGAERTE
jgi:NADH dehydrogenase